MTTIAFDGRIIAADGLRIWGSEIKGRAHKKLIVRHGLIYAFTGLAPMFDVMIDWHNDMADPDKLHKHHDVDGDGWTLIVVDKNGLGKFTSGCPYIERFDPPVAFGACADYAIGAMWAGADAKRAVELVAANCLYTGGEIQAIKVDDVFNPKPRLRQPDDWMPA